MFHQAVARSQVGTPLPLKPSAAFAAKSARRPTKVLIVADHFGYGCQIHGVTTLVGLWATHLDPARYDAAACFLRRRSPLCRDMERRGVKLTALGKGKYDPTTLTSLVRIIRREKIDVLHIQGYGATTFGRLAGFLTGTPVIVHFHDTNPYYPGIQRCADRLLGSLTDGYIAVSDSVKTFWARRCRLVPEQIAVLHNCAALEQFAPLTTDEVNRVKSRIGIPPNSRVIGTVTRLFDGKGTQYLLEAAPEVLRTFPDTTFVIAGDGPLRRKLEESARHLGIRDHVIFLGYVENAAPVLATFDIKVLTSYLEGGSPLPVVEAMAMGKPVIATEVVETIRDGIDGLIIPSQNAAALADKVIWLLGHEAEREKLGRQARKRAKDYDPGRYAEKLGRLYDGVLLKKRAMHS